MKISTKSFWLHITNIFANNYESYENCLLTVSKMIAIAIGDRQARIAISDLKFDQDRDRDRNFRDRGHALVIYICCEIVLRYIHF